MRDIEMAIEHFSPYYNGHGKIAYDALIEKQERENMKPLTVEELKKRSEKPIFIKGLECDESYWAIVGKITDSGIELHSKYSDKYYTDCGIYELYGKTWLAYDFEPKEVAE